MSFNVDDSQGAQAVSYNQLADRWQFSVASGCAVSINSGTLGQADTLTLASGEVIFDGSSTTVAGESVQIDAANASDPRKDVVYVDTNGAAQVAKGTPEAAEPSGDTRFDTYRPAPSDLSGTNAVVVAEVWVPAGASSITSSDLRDRRVFSDATIDTLVTGDFNDVVVAGAHGDGSLQAALDTKEVVLIPPNTNFQPSSTLQYQDNQTIFSWGRRGWIDGSNLSAGANLLEPSATKHANFKLLNLGIRNAPNHGVVLNDPAQGWWIHQCEIRANGGAGIHSTDTVTGWITQCDINNNSGAGFTEVGTSNPTTIYIKDSFIQANNRGVDWNVASGGGRGLHISDCVIDSSTLAGLRINSPLNGSSSIENTWFENNGTGDANAGTPSSEEGSIFINDSVGRIILQNCNLQGGNYANDLNIESGGRIQVYGCSVANGIRYNVGSGSNRYVHTLGSGRITPTGAATENVYVQGVAEQSLSGSPPDATNHYDGFFVRDTDNPDDLYLIYDNTTSSGVARVSYNDENSGTSTQSGDGSTTTFSIPHGLSTTPGVKNVWAESADAAGDFHVSAAGATNIDVTYASAPASGTDNLTWGFEARVL